MIAWAVTVAFVITVPVQEAGLQAMLEGLVFDPAVTPQSCYRCEMIVGIPVDEHELAVVQATASTWSYFAPFMIGLRVRRRANNHSFRCHGDPNLISPPKN